jgi:hypothetical protein
MAFNLDAFREAHRPWSLTVGARTWTARHVSAREVQAYEHKLAAATDQESKAVAAVRWILRRAFPWRFSYLFRGDPVRICLALEPAARREALTDFFACLLGRNPQPMIPTMNGRKSSASTRRQSA